MKSNTSTIRNGKVEFWRFIFSLIIVIHHSRYLLGDNNCMFLGGSLAVEFFFLVSGYLMMASIDKKKAAPTHLGHETATYIGRKFNNLCPDLPIAYVIALAFVSFAKQNTVSQTVLLFINSFFEVTQLKMSGLYSVSLNGVTWYISSMLLCMAILYPLIRKFPDIMTNIVVPLTALLLLGYLSGNYDSPRTPLQWIGLTYKGNIRAMAELCLGVLCYKACQRLTALQLRKSGKLLVTLLEWCCYIVVIWYMYAKKASQTDYFMLLIMMVGITLSFSHLGIDAPLFDHPFIVALGKFSLPLFLSHTFYAQHLNSLLPGLWSGNRRMAIYLLCSFATAALVKLISMLLVKFRPAISQWVKHLLLEKTE